MRNLVNHTLAAYGQLNNPAEFHDKPSKTVPGQTLSIRELLDRYVRGEQVEVFHPTYTDDDIPDHLEHMTEIERKELASDIGQHIQTIQTARRVRAQTAVPLSDPIGEQAPTDGGKPL